MDDDVPMESDGSVATVEPRMSATMADDNSGGHSADGDRGSSGSREVEMGRQTGSRSDDKKIVRVKGMREE